MELFPASKSIRKIPDLSPKETLILRGILDNPHEHDERMKEFDAEREKIARAEKKKPTPFDPINNPPFLGVSRKKMELLAQKVKSADGKVIVLVHPWYVKEKKQYSSVVKGLLAQNKVPVIILQENKKMEQARRRIRKLGPASHLIIRTEEHGPMQILKHENNYFNKPIPDFERIYQMIDAIGGKAVFLGGLESKNGQNVWPEKEIEQYEQEWLQNRKVPAGKKTYDIENCVGYTYRGLVLNAMNAKVKGKKPLKIRLMPGALQDVPWYSQARAQLHEKRTPNFQLKH